MSVKVSWYDDEKTIVLQTFGKDVTAEDWREAARLSNALLTSVDHTVDIIITYTQLTKLPPNLFSASRYVESLIPPNQGVVVVVATQAIIAAFNELMRRLMPKVVNDSVMVSTIDEALAYIAARRTGKE
jgi:hydroxymethylpyrimidine/phosphomethylpyrimidine kinase